MRPTITDGDSVRSSGSATATVIDTTHAVCQADFKGSLGIKSRVVCNTSFEMRQIGGENLLLRTNSATVRSRGPRYAYCLAAIFAGPISKS